MKTRCLNALLAMGICLSASQTFADNGPPNWRLYAEGETVPANDGTGEDIDTFAGRSTHLGRFTGEGRHLLYPNLTFEGYATYTAANGDELDVVYTGSIVSLDEFPFPVEGDFIVTGGTGRFARARGCAKMTGGFTGVPGELTFQLKGTLRLRGRGKPMCR